MYCHEKLRYFKNSAVGIGKTKSVIFDVHSLCNSVQFAFRSNVNMCKNVLLLVLLFRFMFPVDCEIVNSKVIRIIDVQGQLVKINALVSIQNWGLAYINKFVYALDPDIHIFYIKFKSGQDEELLFDKATVKCRGSQSQCYNFHVHFNEHLAPNKSYNVKVELVCVDKIFPLYRIRTFVEDHFVWYTGNLLYYSPYQTLLLETTFVWREIQNLEITHPPHHQTKSSLNYSHTAIAPFSFEAIKMEYTNNKPFLVITNLERIIDVSHFGKIFVEDRIDIKNEGSKLVGPYEHKLSEIEMQASNWWYTDLPASAEDVQYFDAIGNSSKSILLHFEDHKTFKFRPRYPLLSGWKTYYVVKYGVPIFEYLHHDFRGRFVLEMRVVDHVLNDAVIKRSSTKVLLPEAARIVQVDVPYGFDRLENENFYTGLCTFGRPTVVLNGSNILENHIGNVRIEYLFPLSYLFRAPLVIILYLESVFVCFILISHAKSY